MFRLPDMTNVSTRIRARVEFGEKKVKNFNAGPKQ